MQEIASSNRAASTAQPQAVALFVSDVHLHESLPGTTRAFLAFLRGPAKQSQQLYLLGDLFEYWAGDDDIDTPYHQRIVASLRELSDAGVALYWMAGNRDFLVGEAFAQATGATLLPDPYIATVAGQRLSLTHGDAQCTDDVEYMKFRAQVRQEGWQQTFLAQPLAQRKAIIEGMRKESRAAQGAKSYEIMDVSAAAVDALFALTATGVMVHGHTHRPARHEYPDNGLPRVRHVLPDWDVDHAPFRGGWLALLSDGTMRSHSLDDIEGR